MYICNKQIRKEAIAQATILPFFITAISFGCEFDDSMEWNFDVG